MNESFHLREDGVMVEVPSSFRGVFPAFFIDKCRSSFVDFLPLFPAFNRILKISDALFHVAIEHIGDIYLRLASLDDLIGYLMQEP